MREILTGIFSWPWFSEPHGYNLTVASPFHSSSLEPMSVNSADIMPIS